MESLDCKGVIFDLDGVLLDSMGIWQDLGVRYLKKQGITAEPGLSQILFSMSLEQGAEYLETHYPLGKNAQRIGYEIEGLIWDYYCYEVEAKEGAKALMDAFSKKGIPMTGATSSPREHAIKALERVGLLSYFQEILTTTELGTSKHEPMIYELCARKMGAKPEETLVFEDSLYALKTARAAGFQTVGVYDAYGESAQEGLKASCDLYVMNMTEIIDN